MSIGHVAITDLVDVCDRMAATNRALFERLGAWVTDEPDPSRQQWFAVACHRHAWHGELWTERRPKIPLEPTGEPAELEPTGGDRAGWYADRLAELQDALADLEASVDPTLDPSTSRVIHLVAADLADLVTSHPS